jgi:hypothetical protein
MPPEEIKKTIIDALTWGTVTVPENLYALFSTLDYLDRIPLNAIER